METFQFTAKMFQRYFRILVELAVLLVSAVFIYLEELFRLLISRPGKSLEGEVILVTGSANGLGKELCRELVKYRAKIVLWDVSEDENMKSAQALKALGAEHVYLDTVDVSDRNQVVRAASKVRNNFGHVTILVNNAGICPMQQLLELTPEAVEATFQTNIIAHFWTVQEFLPHMLEVNKGHIVTICSTMGQMAVRGPCPYYATKHAVHGFVECLKDELAHYPNNPNIKFTTAYPFFMRTRMVQGDNCGLLLKFKFPSLTPFMEASEVAKRIVDGIRYEQEYLYIPETFRIYLAGKFFLPSKLHRRSIDFFVEESGYSSQLGNVNGYTAIKPERQANRLKSSSADPNPIKFGNEFSTTPSSWLSGNMREKEK